MTYLTWGCDPLKEECESCLDALCNACVEQFRKKSGTNETPDGLEIMCQDSDEPDCDNCNLEKKPDCSHCEIILGVCRNCPENITCEFRIC